MTTILVTGGNRQLATCIKDLEKKHDDLNLIYTDYLELDICDLNQINTFFQSKSQIYYCFNCAAYTAVDQAEKDQEKAYQINVIGAKNLALACNTAKTTLIHISTDFVFDGKKSKPYIETDETNTISVYGETKIKGEIEILNILKTHFIIRTSWLYSEHGNNFVKTMLRFSKEMEELSIVNDQIGTLAYAGDLARVIFHIIKMESLKYGIYHYSNEGFTSWFDFAEAIFEHNNIKIKLNPIPALTYPTPAKRPEYSVMDKSKIKNTLGVHIPFWEESLKSMTLN